VFIYSIFYYSCIWITVDLCNYKYQTVKKTVSSLLLARRQPVQYADHLRGLTRTVRHQQQRQHMQLIQNQPFQPRQLRQAGVNLIRQRATLAQQAAALRLLQQQQQRAGLPALRPRQRFFV